MLGARGATQHDRVAGLQAQGRGVDRDVRARLVDNRDHAQRDAHLAHIQTVWQALTVDHLANRVGQLGDGLNRLCDPLDPLCIEAQAIEQRGADIGLAPGHQIALVGAEDLLGALTQCGRDRCERGVLRGGVDAGQNPRRVTCALAGVRHR